MEHYDDAMKYAEAASDSAGSGMEKFSAYTDSVEAKITKFQNAFQSLSTTVADSDFMSSFIDTGTDVLNFIDLFIDKVGILQTVIGAVVFGKGISSFVKSFDKPYRVI